MAVFYFCRQFASRFLALKQRADYFLKLHISKYNLLKAVWPLFGFEFDLKIIAFDMEVMFDNHKRFYNNSHYSSILARTTPTRLKKVKTRIEFSADTGFVNFG